MKQKARKNGRKMRKSATKQAGGGSPLNGVVPPIERQFGQPNGNPRSDGHWKKEDTLRYKLEKLINGVDEDELQELLEDPKTKPGVKRLAMLLYKSNYEKPESEWRVWESALNQAYGFPKQPVEKTELEPPLPLSPRGAQGQAGERSGKGGNAAIAAEPPADATARADRSAPQAQRAQANGAPDEDGDGEASEAQP